jgi:hypothetical protein
MGEKIPTRYVVTGLGAVFLAVSAAFGGLADAPVEPVPAVAAGESVSGAQLRIAVERAVLIDGFPEQGIEPAEGSRLLVLVAEVENVHTRPVSTSGDGFGASDNLRPVGVAGLDADSAPLSVAVLDDGSEFPELQPGVPIELAFIWEIADGALADGDRLAVDVYDKTYRANGFVTYGERFDDRFVAATTELEVSDVGAGVSG